jgi:hypothetical protein
MKNERSSSWRWIESLRLWEVGFFDVEVGRAMKLADVEEATTIELLRSAVRRLSEWRPVGLLKKRVRRTERYGGGGRGEEGSGGEGRRR